MSAKSASNTKTGKVAALVFDVSMMQGHKDWPGTEMRQEFYVPVHGFLWFYPDELEIIDHPSFQRLAGMHQLGLAYLIFRGATHKRFEHVLGTVAVAQRMVDAANHNCNKRSHYKPDAKDAWVLGRGLTPTEERFIRLAALLHDIGHVPYGHTFEDELHLLDKHDEEPRLDRILNKVEWPGSGDEKFESLASLIDRLYQKYLVGSVLTKQKPSDLVKNIIAHKPIDGLADAGLRITVCADIVGNTICADLLDYLHRDWYHVGKERRFDERLLQYMEIRTPRRNEKVLKDGFPAPCSEDAFVICVGNRPKLRTDGISGMSDAAGNRHRTKI